MKEDSSIYKQFIENKGSCEKFFFAWFFKKVNFFYFLRTHSKKSCFFDDFFLIFLSEKAQSHRNFFFLQIKNLLKY